MWNDLKMTWIQLEEHWNYKAGDSLKVQVMSNCDETELLLGGRSLGRKKLPAAGTPPELVWPLTFAEGELKAVGYRNGQPVAEEVLRTAGKPARIVATCDADTLRADGLDLAYIDYVVLDKDGNVCPVNDLKLSFTVKGSGTNAGVANANMLSDEPWQADSRSAYQGRAQLIIRSHLSVVISSGFSTMTAFLPASIAASAGSRWAPDGVVTVTISTSGSARNSSIVW